MQSEVSQASSVNEFLRKRKKMRKGFLFDNLWGIGGFNKMDLQLLRTIKHRQKFKSTAVESREEMPLVILDEVSIAENRDHCCNNAFGRSCREFAWNSSAMDGLKFTVFSASRRMCDRILWALICIIAFCLAIYVTVRAAEFLTNDPIYIAVESIGLSRRDEVPFPKVSVCPAVNFFKAASNEAKRADVEAKLPPMAHMWGIWENSIKGRFDPDDTSLSFANLPWSNDTVAVKRLMQQVMIDGGIMSMPTCQDILSECQECCTNNAQLSLTPDGPCYEFDVEKSAKKANRSNRVNLGHFLEMAFDDLRVNLTLTGTTSARIGYPIVTARYFGSSYLCPDNWGDVEAKVMCKSLGFSGGERYTMSDRAMTFFPSSIYGLDIQCEGQETELSQCSRNYDSITGQTLQDCKSLSRPVGIICDQVSLNLGDNLGTKTRGLPRIPVNGEATTAYFCSDSFDNNAASILCNMLSWPHGRAANLFGGNANYTSSKVKPPTKSVIRKLECPDDPAVAPHILDCHYELGDHDETCQPAAVECGPGFPLTLRMFDKLLEANRLQSNKVSLGYPVIDTTTRPGFICDAGEKMVNDEAVEKICTYLGFRYGAKWPQGLYGRPEENPLFVLDSISCTGSESSVFACDLGPWGDHECDSQDEILTVICANEESHLHFDHVAMDPNNYIEASSYAKSGLVGLYTAFGNVPVCLQDDGLVRHWRDRESNFLCQKRGFSCGMIDRRRDKNEGQLDLLHERLLTGVFATIQCPEGESDELKDLSKCRHQLFDQCPSGRAANFICIDPWDDPEEHELCQLLQAQVLPDAQESLATAREVVLAFNFSQGFERALDECGLEEEEVDHSSALLKVDDDDYEFHLRPGFEFGLRFGAKLLDSDKFALRQTHGVSCNNDDDYEERECFDRCRTEIAVLVCNCIPWHLSQINFDTRDDYDLCKHHKVVCAKRISTALQIAPTNFSLAEAILIEADLTTSAQNLSQLRKTCTCLEPCQGLVKYHLEQKIMSRKLCQQTELAKVHLSLDNRVSIRLKRRTLAIWETIVGSAGGIFSLFCGASLILIVELLYFSTVRWWDNANDPILKKNDDDDDDDDDIPPVWRRNDQMRRTASDSELLKALYMDPTLTLELSKLEENDDGNPFSNSNSAVSFKSLRESRPQTTKSRLTDIEELDRFGSSASLRSRNSGMNSQIQSGKSTRSAKVRPASTSSNATVLENL